MKEALYGDNLLEQARIIGKHASEKGVLTEALQEYMQRRKQIEILNLFIPPNTIPPMITKNSEEGRESPGRYECLMLVTAEWRGC